jgi:hypothetical protein
MIEELDDNLEDPGYEDEETDSEEDMFDMLSENDQEEMTMEAVRRKEKPQPEIRVYKDPPVE